MAWGAGLWLVVVAVPYLYLYPGENLDRPTCLLLAALAPAAMLVAAAWSPTHLLLGVGLASHVPILIACPELIGPRITGSMQGLAVAVMLLGFVAATFDLATGPQWRASPGRRLRHLARWPKSWTGRLMLLLGILWLGAAWLVPSTVAAERVEAVRTARVVAAALCWMVVRTVPVAHVALPSSVGSPAGNRPWMPLVQRRLLWFVTLVGTLMWWHG